MSATNGASEEIDIIEAIEQEGINFLYDLEHAQNNLFFAKMDGVGDSPFRISNISIATPSLSFERNSNKNFSLTGATVPDEVTIEWVEDTYRSVEKFHLSWLRNWYDFNNDCIPIGPMDKFKNIIITAFHYKNINESVSAPISKAEPVFELHLLNCVPTGMGGNQEFNWEGGNLKTLSVTYNVSKVFYSYIGNYDTGIGSPETTKDGYLLRTHGDRRSSLGNETAALEDLSSNQRWLDWKAWDTGKSAYAAVKNPGYVPPAKTAKDIENAGSALENNR